MPSKLNKLRDSGPPDQEDEGILSKVGKFLSGQNKASPYDAIGLSDADKETGRKLAASQRPKQVSEMSDAEVAANPEEGAHEEDFVGSAQKLATLDQDIPGMAMMMPTAGLARAGEAAEELGNSSRLSKLKQPSKQLYQNAIRDPEVLQNMHQDLEGAEGALKNRDKAMRAGAQNQKDIVEGVKPAGLGAKAKPYQGDYVSDLNSTNEADMNAMRTGGKDLSSAYQKPEITETTKSIQYTDPKAQRMNLKRERMDLDMSKPDSRLRMKQIDQALSDLEQGSVRSVK